MAQLGDKSHHESIIFQIKLEACTNLFIRVGRAKLSFEDILQNCTDALTDGKRIKNSLDQTLKQKWP